MRGAGRADRRASAPTHHRCGHRSSSSASISRTPRAGRPQTARPGVRSSERGRKRIGRSGRPRSSTTQPQSVAPRGRQRRYGWGIVTAAGAGPSRRSEARTSRDPCEIHDRSRPPSAPRGATRTPEPAIAPGGPRGFSARAASDALGARPTGLRRDARARIHTRVARVPRRSLGSRGIRASDRSVSARADRGQRPMRIICPIRRRALRPRPFQPRSCCTVTP